MTINNHSMCVCVVLQNVVRLVIYTTSNLPWSSSDSESERKIQFTVAMHGARLLQKSAVKGRRGGAYNTTRAMNI